MIYAFLAVLIAGIGIGAGGMHKFDLAEIQSLQNAIDTGNAEAERTLKDETAKVAEATSEAERAKKQLERSHETAIATANDYSDKLHNSLASRANSLSRSACTSVPAEAARDAYLPSALAGVLSYVDGETTRADAVAAYAQSCWQFVSNNCGVKKQ